MQFNDTPPSDTKQNNVATARPVTLEGYITMQDVTTKTWKKRYGKLSPGKFEYYVTKKDPDTLGVVNLQGCKLKLVKVDGVMQVLQLLEPAGAEYYLYGTPIPETLIWKDAITLAMSQPLPEVPITPTVPTSQPNPMYSDFTNVTTNLTPVNNTKLVEEAYLVQLFFYLISQGETISDIANTFGVTVPWIQGCNSSNLNSLVTGSIVIIPFQGELPAIVASNPMLMEAHIKAVTPDRTSDDDGLCKICFEKPINTVLLECGHAALCGGCAQAITGQPCPFCRRPVSRVMLTYQSS